MERNNNKVECSNCKAKILKSSLTKHKKSKKCIQFSIFINPIDNEETYNQDQSQNNTTESISSEEQPEPVEKTNNNVVIDLMLKQKMQKEKIKNMCMRIWDEVTIERENEKKKREQIIQEEYDNTDIELMEALNSSMEALNSSMESM